ncbi:MAG: thiamine phosphate synthase [Muribaculaceae bacterium]|nr:thiamine phosphate synthase [Muribaculaceae bacterium]
MMTRIVITLPYFFDGESAAIECMLNSGADRVHLRKPGCTEAQLRTLIEGIGCEYRYRLSLHDHLTLACEYGLGGVHLNKRNDKVPEGFTGLVSKSCHTIAELNDSACYNYVFLSPIFDSISKEGYKAAFNNAELVEAKERGLINSRVYALGGVYPGNFAETQRLGFGGYALLGSAWAPMKKGNFRLHYIAGPVEGSDAVESTCTGAVKALEGGCRWIQIRMKDADDDEMLRVAQYLAPICHEYGATLLLDDRVNLVPASGAHGVHLGKNDMPPAEARRILGPGYIIGSTANTFSDIEAANSQGADYIGLGPLRFTTTKKNLSPVLGYEGYRRICGDCRRHNISLPIVAIGGITPDDIAPLLVAGVAGVAVSGAIVNADDATAATAEFISHLS